MWKKGENSVNQHFYSMEKTKMIVTMGFPFPHTVSYLSKAYQINISTYHLLSTNGLSMNKADLLSANGLSMNKADLLSANAFNMKKAKFCSPVKDI